MDNFYTFIAKYITEKAIYYSALIHEDDSFFLQKVPDIVQKIFSLTHNYHIIDHSFIPLPKTQFVLA